MRYIHVWRRSPTARYLDVQVVDNNIAIFSSEDYPDMIRIETEEELIAYVNGTDTESRAVTVQLSTEVLGWTVEKKDS